jgi:aminomethyltransferase
VATLPFLHGGHFELDGMKLYVSCSGYTGEDGFELSCPAADATSLARRMLAAPEVQPIGLGARDSLRLEAGLCLYGHELAPTITPIEAGIAWAVSRARRPDGDRPGGYPGAEHIEAQLAAGPRRRRVGLTVNGKRPVREGQAVVDDAGRHVGEITSGGFGASVNAPIALALIDRAAAESDVPLSVNVRGRLQGRDAQQDTFHRTALLPRLKRRSNLSPHFSPHLTPGARRARHTGTDRRRSSVRPVALCAELL